MIPRVVLFCLMLALPSETRENGQCIKPDFEPGWEDSAGHL